VVPSKRRDKLEEDFQHLHEHKHFGEHPFKSNRNKTHSQKGGRSSEKPKESVKKNQNKMDMKNEKNGNTYLMGRPRRGCVRACAIPAR
jgi:hypothetical protein